MSINDKYLEIKSLCIDFYSEMDKLVTKVFCDTKICNSEYFDDLKSYLFGESKQIRSCLIFLFAKNLGYNSTDNDIIKLATAVEIIHNATLIHDDIIDDSPIRRGHISLHKKYSNKLGVISGDFLLSIALNLLLELPSQVMKNFGTCLNSLCYGEINQYFALKKTPSIDEYLKKTEQKTASLFVAGLKSLIQMKNLEFFQETEMFALHFGRAFQIKDDLKNIISKDENKPVLNDIIQGIYTLPVIYSYGENKDLSDIEPNEIIKLSTDNEPLKKTIQLLNSEIDNAINQLSSLTSNEFKNAIIQLCELFKEKQ